MENWRTDWAIRQEMRHIRTFSCGVLILAAGALFTAICNYHGNTAHWWESALSAGLLFTVSGALWLLAPRMAESTRDFHDSQSRGRNS